MSNPEIAAAQAAVNEMEGINKALTQRCVALAQENAVLRGQLNDANAEIRLLREAVDGMGKQDGNVPRDE